MSQRAIHEYAPALQQVIDIPQGATAPFAVVELANQMLVKKVLIADSLQDAVEYLVTFLNRGEIAHYRIVTEVDQKKYLTHAHTVYRNSWDGDAYVGAKDFRDVSNFPFLYR